MHQAVVLENSCVGEGFPAFLALIWPSIGVNAFVANLFAAIIEMPITVQTLVGSLTRVSSYMCAKFAHLTKWLEAYSERYSKIKWIQDFGKDIGYAIRLTRIDAACSRCVPSCVLWMLPSWDRHFRRDCTYISGMNSPRGGPISSAARS